MLGRLKYYAFLISVGMVMYLMTAVLPSSGGLLVEAQNGVASFSGVDLQNGYARVTSGWESYPGALLSPDDFAAEKASAPVRWEYGYGEGESVGSHRMKLALPVGHPVAIRFRSVEYATKVFIGGGLVGEVGVVGATKETTVPLIGDCYYVVTPMEAETEIILQYANFHHRRGGYPPELTIGAPVELTRLSQKETFAQAMVAGLLFAAFLYHMAMYLFYGGRSAYLCFSLCSLAFSVRALPPLLIAFLPNYNWTLMLRIDYINMFAGAALFMLFIRCLFPTIFPKGILYTAAALLAVYIGVVTFTTPAFFSRLLVVVQPLCMVALGYIMVKLGLALKKGEGSQQKPDLSHSVRAHGGGGNLDVRLAFVGIAIFLITVVNDVLQLNKRPSIGVNLMPMGIAVFTLAYMMILSMEFAANERRLEAEAGRLSMEMKMKEQALAADNAALDRLSRMRAEMIAVVTHETLTPLAVLSGYAQLVSRELRLKGVDLQTAMDLDRIADETQRIAWLMDEMQSHLREQDGRLSKTRFSLAELINSVARMYAPILQRKSVKISIRILCELKDVYASAAEITQVLFNLLSNARNHAQGGRVTISAEEEDDFIVVTVSDEGCGIPPELLPHVLERGVSGTDNGMGLGLAICKEIIDRHGGMISIASEQHKGTDVRFMLPVWREEAGATQ